MSLLTRIFDRIAFVRAEYLAEGGCQMEVYMLRRGVFSDADWAAAKGVPVMVILCGQGVVTKPDDAQIVTRIREEDEVFLWSSCGGSTSFLRRERLPEVIAAVKVYGIFPVRVLCADAGTEFSVTAKEYAGQFYEGLKWKELVRVTDLASAMAQAAVRRIALLMLGCFLLLLVANALVAPGLNTRREALQESLAERERTHSQTDASDQQQRQLLSEFAPSAPAYALICDRIASAVPETVVLRSLEVEPLEKRFEAEKPLQRRNGVVVVLGEAPAAAAVSQFVVRLAEGVLWRKVRLAGVETERDKDALTFLIEIEL